MNPNHDVVEIKLKPELFLNKITTIMGASNMGYAALVQQIVLSMLIKTPNIVVMCDMSEEYKYENLIETFAVFTITDANLKNVYEKQIKNAEIYNKINNISTLEQIFNYVDAPDEKKYINIIAEVNPNNIENKNELLIFLYKKFINEYSQKLLLCDKLSADEKFIISNINLNPYCVLIFDNKMPNIQHLYKNNNTILSK